MASRILGRWQRKLPPILHRRSSSLVWKPQPPPPATRLYVWGCNLGGSLAAETHLKPVITEPAHFPLEPVSINRPFIKVACGVDFTILLNAKSHDIVYTGCNVGMSHALSLFEACWANEEVPDDRLPWYTDEEDAAEFFHPGCGAYRLHVPNQSAAGVTCVSAGREHAVFITVDHQVFIAGKDRFGQCGGKSIRTPLTPPDLMGFTPYYIGADLSDLKAKRGCRHVVPQHLGRAGSYEHEICDVSSGLDHTLLMSNAGFVFTFGLNTDGQCGQGTDAVTCELNQPAGLINDAVIRDISSSADSSAALDEEGRLFTWGNNEYGQLLLKTEAQQVATPDLVDELHLREALRGSKPIRVGMGGSYGALLDENGSVWTWGHGAALGQGKHVQVSHWPRRVNIPGRVVQIRCGINNMAAVDENGGMYAWGAGLHSSIPLAEGEHLSLEASHHLAIEEGDTGLNQTEAPKVTIRQGVWEPRQIKIEYPVIDCGVGLHHMACIGEEYIV